MKVLIGAYACEPGAGSEPGTGWSWARAAALAGHEVWILTRTNNEPAIQAALNDEPNLGIRCLTFDLPRSFAWWKRGQRGIHLYYLLWQIAAGHYLKTLQTRERFDIAHHLTLAIDWLPSAIDQLKIVPTVWGPIGGTTQPPLMLLHHLGVRGQVSALARGIVGGIGRRLWGRTAARNAAVTIALNPDVARWFQPLGAVIIEPNSAFDLAALRAGTIAGTVDVHQGPRHAVFVGRLEPWKGLAVALRALARPEASAWVLEVYGEGPDRERAERIVRRLGIGNRVMFKGRVPRDEALRAIGEADALIHPALHDSAPWVVGEAATLGTPIVCFSSGGPATLASAGRVEIVRKHFRAPKQFARALSRLEKEPPPAPSDRWSEERLPEFLSQLYAGVLRDDRRAEPQA